MISKKAKRALGSLMDNNAEFLSVVYNFISDYIYSVSNLNL
ncbi:hypothetical protein [Bacillus thuringiensis]|nr:hypothetical protein [Bacillus thuringiensis]